MDDRDDYGYACCWHARMMTNGNMVGRRRGDWFCGGGEECRQVREREMGWLEREVQSNIRPKLLRGCIFSIYLYPLVFL
jgi:hypothetical protein